MNRIFLVLGLCCVSASLMAVDAMGQHFDPQVFLKSYCWDCHDEGSREGDRRLDDLLVDPGTDVLMAERWEEVMHQLQLAEMPPAGEKQPSGAERRELIEWVRSMSEAVREKTEGRSAQVTHRRLNHEEYLHTVRDLFGITEGDFDPTTEFPADQAADGFRNNGRVLQTSPQLIEAYFRAADQIIDYVDGLAKAVEVTQPQTWSIRATQPERVMDSTGIGIRVSTAADGSKHISLAHGLTSHDLTYDGKLFFKDFIVSGLEHSGWYEFTVVASGANRFHPYGDALKWSIAERYYHSDKEFYDQTRPIQLGIGTQFGGTPQQRTRTRPNLRVIDELPDNEFITRTYRVWLDQGSRPYLSFVNGPPKGVKMQFVTNRLWEFDNSVPRIKPAVRDNLTDRAKRNELYYDRYQGPELRIQEVEMKGPFFDASPPAVELLFGRIPPEATSVKAALLRRELSLLASTFYRKPQTVETIEPFAAVIESRLAEGLSYREALRPVLKAFLCSPSFLFLTEEKTNKAESLRVREIANRLSYFLHASLPEKQMVSRLTAAAELNEALTAEVERLLESPKAERFFQLFADQWLGLDELGSMPPGTEEFPAYYIHELEEAGKQETYRFLAASFRENLPVTDLVDADFTFVNRGLASLYQLTPPEGNDWQRVRLPPDSLRRGLPGQASVLTVTANGVDTSPVIRGVWMLEKLFGTPPAPPPPDVPAIEPDIRGAKTIRDLLEKHREVKACADCHNRIDPLGYAFESFDPIGRIRETYDSGSPIDTTGEYRGVPIRDVRDIRKYLLEHPQPLAHNVAQRLLTYSLGRSIEFQDRGHLNELVRRWEMRGYGMQELVKLIVTCPLFTSP